MYVAVIRKLHRSGFRKILILFIAVSATCSDLKHEQNVACLGGDLPHSAKYIWYVNIDAALQIFQIRDIGCAAKLVYLKFDMKIHVACWWATLHTIIFRH